MSKAYTFKNQCLESEITLREKIFRTQQEDTKLQKTEELEEEEECVDNSYKDINLIFLNDDQSQLSQIVEEELEEDENQNNDEYDEIIEEQTELGNEYRYTIKSNDGNAIQISIHDQHHPGLSSNYEILQKMPIIEVENKQDSEYEEYDELKMDEDEESESFDLEKNTVKIEAEELQEHESENQITNELDEHSQQDESQEQNDSNTDTATNSTVLKLYLPEEAKQSGNVKGKYACTICFRILSNRNSLNYHMQLHSDKASYVCNICGEKFKTRNAYTGHMTTHEPESQHKCDICNKSYRQAASLKSHMLSHTGQKPFG